MSRRIKGSDENFVSNPQGAGARIDGCENRMARSAIQNTNLASELFVASQLFRLGYAVTITLGHTKEIDLYVAHPDGKRIVTIDVKGLKNTTNWPLHPKRKSKDHFYVLVSYLDKFGDLDSQPDVFVIPSLELDRVLSPWSGRPDVTAVAYHRIKNSKYKNAWPLLFGG